METMGLKTTSTLRRHNSIATSVVVPTKLTLPSKPRHTASFPTSTTASAVSSYSSSYSSSHSFPPGDCEIISIQPLLSYTSLKDILPSDAVNSPVAASPRFGVGDQIFIRNRLVKQAAWAYLRPMSISPESSGSHFLHRLWAKISDGLLESPIASFLRCFLRTVTRAFEKLLRAVR